ncbi:MAG: hypothetical protein Q4C70_06265 [Planctomycetia bacterium]|nr:hypothetical protein [Planctomycetia bacterium]
MALFTENGFQLAYPAEWEVEYDGDENPHEVTFYSPNGAFWTLTRRPGFVDPDDLLKESIEALTSEYEDAEISTAREEYTLFDAHSCSNNHGKEHHHDGCCHGHGHEHDGCCHGHGHEHVHEQGNCKCHTQDDRNSVETTCRIDGFDLDFFYLDLPCMAMLRALRFGSYTYFVYIQTMDQSSSMMAELKGITRYWAEHLDMMEM